MVAAVHDGERNVEQIRSIGLRRLEAIVEAEVEYLAIVCEESLEELRELDRLARILVVVQIDGVRLLDNMPIELQSPVPSKSLDL
jgi:pantothenate synthetase